MLPQVTHLQQTCSERARMRHVLFVLKNDEEPLQFVLAGGQERNSKIFVSHVDEKSPASKAGLRVADQVEQLFIYLFIYSIKVLMFGRGRMKSLIVRSRGSNLNMSSMLGVLITCTALFEVYELDVIRRTSQEHFKSIEMREVTILVWLLLFFLRIMFSQVFLFSVRKCSRLMKFICS